MSRASRELIGPGLLALGMVALVLAPAAGQGKAAVKHLVLAAAAVPDDPFSEANQAGGKMAVARGSTFLLVVEGHTTDDWYTYPLTKRAPAQTGKLAKIAVEGTQFSLLPGAAESDPQWKAGNEFVGPELVHKKPFTWKQEVYVRPDAAPGPTKLTLLVKAQVCKGSCVDEAHAVEVPLTISTAPKIPPDDALEAKLNARPAEPTTVPVPEELRAKDGDGGGGPKKRATGLVASVGTAALGGFVSLLTPCVFPMIPITVSYFLKQAERRGPSAEGASPRSPVLLALVYSGTIVLVLTLGGLLTQEALVKLISHPLTNLALGLLFLYFACSLLGWYDVTLPSWLQDMTSSREGRGGVVGVFFMALTFSIVSFACVGPIYASFLGLQATSAGALGVVERVAPVLAYSMAFASPFFVLAMFPTLLRTMPRAGSWMNTVKVVLGFLELAAVVKFFRSAELLYRGRADLMSYELSMGLYVALCVACGMYLLGLYRLPHDHDPVETVSVPSMALGVGFLALGLYLTPALFKVGGGGDAPQSQRPSGTLFAWVDSFLLPDPVEGEGWEHDLNKALAKARGENKLVFVDFTGVNCTNCKLNEGRIFTRPDVKAAFRRHVLLKLYADKVPAGVEQVPDVEGTEKLRWDTFESNALPLYALLRPTGEGKFEVVGRFADDANGLIEVGDVPAFLKFLSR